MSYVPHPLESIERRPKTSPLVVERHYGIRWPAIHFSLLSGMHISKLVRLSSKKKTNDDITFIKEK